MMELWSYQEWFWLVTLQVFKEKLCTGLYISIKSVFMLLLVWCIIQRNNLISSKLKMIPMKKRFDVSNFPMYGITRQQGWRLAFKIFLIKSGQSVCWKKQTPQPANYDQYEGSGTLGSRYRNCSGTTKIWRRIFFK